MASETRLHPRVSVNWHAFVETSSSSIEIELRDISVTGACILHSVEPELIQRFPFFLEPPGAKSICVVAETVWSAKCYLRGKEYFRTGIRFLAINPEDQQFIETFVEREK